MGRAYFANAFPVHFPNMPKTKMSVKVKGSPKQVKKAIAELVSEVPSPVLREADFRVRQKRTPSA
jgi:hypothetical protein